MTDVVVRSCDPREYEAPIRALFARNDHPQFDAVFERAYRPRAERGMRSWIGLRGEDVVMHVSVSPLPFADGTRTLTAGVMSDLMVDRSFRDFWAPLQLLRQVRADMKRAPATDFLFTTTTPEAASLFKAGGFKPFDQLRRYVMPLVAPWIAWSGLRRHATRYTARPDPLGSEEWERLLPGLGAAAPWRPVPSPGFYATRVPRSDYADATWLALDDRRGAIAGLAMLSGHAGRPEVALADVFWRDGVNPGDLALAAARWARRRGLRKFSVMTLEGSRLAAIVRRSGFITRRDCVPILLQQLGPTAPPPPADWCITGLVGSTW